MKYNKVYIRFDDRPRNFLTAMRSSNERTRSAIWSEDQKGSADSVHFRHVKSCQIMPKHVKSCQIMPNPAKSSESIALFAISPRCESNANGKELAS